MTTTNSLVYLVYSLISLVAHDRPTPNFSPRAWEVTTELPDTDSWPPRSIVEKYNEDSCPSGEKWDECQHGCEHTCENVDGPLICPKMCIPGCVCEPGRVRGPNGQCIAPSRCPSPQTPSSALNPICQQEIDVGPCRRYVPRYFYNKDTHQCERFVYGGCKGNQNNFRSQDECESNCRSDGAVEWSWNWNQQHPSIPGSNAEQYPTMDPDDLAHVEQYSTMDPDELNQADQYSTVDPDDLAHVEQYSTVDPDELDQADQYSTVDPDELDQAEQYSTVDPDELNQAEQYTRSTPRDNSNNGGCPNSSACIRKCQQEGYIYGLCSGSSRLTCQCYRPLP